MKTVTTPLRTLATIVAVAGLIVMTIAGTASAQQAGYPSAAGATISGSLTPGGLVTINGTGVAGDAVLVLVDSTTVASGTVGADGTFSMTATISANLAPGSHVLAVQVAGVTVASTAFTVAGETAAPALPVTGGNSLPLLSLSLGFIAVGGLVLIARRKATSA